MSKYNDEYDEYDDYEDEDDDYEEVDEEEEDDDSPRSASNPFSRSGGSNLPGSSGSGGANRSSVSGAGLPSRPSPYQGGSGSSGSGGSGSGSGGITTPSPIRGAQGGNPQPQRPSSGGSGSGGASGGSSSGQFNRPSSPFQSGSGGSGSGSSGSSSGGGSGGGFNRPSTPSGGSGSGGSGSGGSGSSSGGSNPFNRPSSGGSSSGGSSGGFGSGSSGGSSGFGGRDNASQSQPRKDDKSSSSGGGLGNRLGNLAGSSDRPGDKKDDKSKSSSGGGLGGLAGRFGGGDKKDDKSKASSSGSSGGGLSGLAGGLAGRFGGGGDKKDNKSSSGGSGGGLMGKLGGGSSGGSSQSGSRPASSGSSGSSSSSSSGGMSSRLGNLGGSSQSGSSQSASSSFGSRPGGAGSSSSSSKPASNNPLGGLASRLPFGNRGGASSSGSAAGSRPGASGASASSAAGGRTATKSSTARGASFNVGDRLKSFFNPSADKKSVKTKISKAPKVEQGGLTLDQKLDILGVALVLVSAGILLSSLSPSQGAITGGITTFLSQLFGQIAVAVPIIMFAAGVYLILRHFGDEAPVIGATRLIGIALLLVSALVIFQYVDALSYPPSEGQSFEDYLNALRGVLLPLSADFGRGGGIVGGELYYFLIANFGEVLGFLLTIAVAIIGIMLTLKLSAAELAIIILSVGRSFGDSMVRRRQVAAIRRQERAEQEAARQVAIGVPSGAAQAQLPGTSQSALPAPIPAPPLPANANVAAPAGVGDERTVQFTMRGQTMTASLDDNAPNAPAATLQPVPQSVPQTTTTQPQVRPQGVPAAQPDDTKSGGLFGRFGRGAAQTAAAGAAGAVIAAGSEKDQKQEQKSGGLFGRLGRGDKQDTAQTTPTPASANIPTMREAVQMPARPMTTSPALEAATSPQPASQTTISPATPPKPADSAGESAPRLGDLLRDQSAQFQRPPAGDPAASVQEDWTKLPPAQPRQPAASNDDLGETRSVSQPSQPATPLAPQPFQRPPISATNAAKEQPQDGEKEELPIRGLTSPVVTHRSTAPSASAPRIVSMGDDESEIERKKTNEIPAPPPSARNAGILSRSSDGADDVPAPPPKPKYAIKDWKMPDFSQLLVSGQDQELDHSFLINRAKIIQDTLESFGAPGRVVEVRTGPVITQFGVEPDYILARGKKSRVKVGAIAALDKDLQLALGAKSIRIEAPVPGKGYVGIEVPNEHSSIVRLRNVMESSEFKKITGPLAIALGESVDGTPVAGDLASMPHLLIAGTTGSGKSVCVNSIIASLLLRNQPHRMKFIMVDPKRVELTQYNGIPHLVSPVVTELERIVSVLKWVTREMDERYRKFSAAGARNIEDYNRHLREGDEIMPYIVVIIDELADLMMLAPDETEKVITRIAALARATGIHLVIATQRPSVDVVTGLIKANFPARIAFAVAGGVDSRVILDQPGAERLLGRGDMLYMSGDSPAPVRLQGVFVGDTEINNITRHWRSQMTEEDLIAASRPLPSAFADDTRDAVRDPRDSIGTGTAWNPSVAGRGTPQTQARPQQAFWDREVTGQGAMVQSMRRDDDDDDFEDGDDAMYNEAVDMVRRLGKASVSLLQRRLRIGYTRAARLIDLMEERGVVGPASEGSKPRDVLTTKE